jgi:hypothetical protein
VDLASVVVAIFIVAISVGGIVASIVAFFSCVVVSFIATATATNEREHAHGQQSDPG